MTRWFVLAGLAVLNGILGAGVYQHVMERPAQAQIGAGAQANVAAVAGVSNGQTVVYLLDANTGRLAAMRVDVSNQRIDPVARRDVAADLKR